MKRFSGERTDQEREALKAQLRKHIGQTGEEVNNDLLNILSETIKDRTWEHYLDQKGKRFTSLRAWLEYAWPVGCDLGKGEFRLTWDQIRAFCEKRPTLRETLRLLDENCLGEVGGDGSNQHQKKSKGYNITLARGTSKAYLAARLAREHPQVYQRYLDGEEKYRSVHAAAVAAGIVKKNCGKLTARLKSHWKNATPEWKTGIVQELKGFLAWVVENP